jgi:hypothetical protein
MNDELESESPVFQFIVHRSAFIVKKSVAVVNADG